MLLRIMSWYELRKKILLRGERQNTSIYSAFEKLNDIFKKVLNFQNVLISHKRETDIYWLSIICIALSHKLLLHLPSLSFSCDLSMSRMAAWMGSFGCSSKISSLWANSKSIFSGISAEGPVGKRDKQILFPDIQKRFCHSMTKWSEYY